jgi:NAD(P)-dependent dehydrogenase (short-subunit alcohol dehydrogenase family)
MTNRVKERKALVTGGTRGIGLAITQMLLGKGSAVFICGTKSRGVEDALSLLRDKGNVDGMVCDVRDHGQVRSMVEKAVQTLGGIDILINNAGVGNFNPVEKMNPDEWRVTLETNLSGVFYCCHETIPVMKRGGGGYIINIGSLAGKNAFPGGAAYNASKFGLIGFSEALMQEVRYDHIRVSYVMPGSVDTDFGRSPRDSESKTWKLLPEDVAGVVLNLLETDPRALSSRVELRPSEPKRG